MNASSGLTALATTTDAVVEAISNEKALGANHLQVNNEGAVAGFISWDGGSNWHRVKASTIQTYDHMGTTNAVQIKRVAGGSNMADVYVSVWS